MNESKVVGFRNEIEGFYIITKGATDSTWLYLSQPHYLLPLIYLCSVY